MTFRVALFAAAALTLSGAAQAQTLQPTVDRVVVHTDGKSMREVRAELWRASETVCRTGELFETQPASDCVNATYGAALRQARQAVASVRPTAVASR